MYKLFIKYKTNFLKTRKIFFFCSISRKLRFIIIESTSILKQICYNYFEVLVQLCQKESSCNTTYYADCYIQIVSECNNWYCVWIFNNCKSNYNSELIKPFPNTFVTYLINTSTFFRNNAVYKTFGEIVSSWEYVWQICISKIISKFSHLYNSCIQDTYMQIIKIEKIDLYEKLKYHFVQSKELLYKSKYIKWGQKVNSTYILLKYLHSILRNC